MGGAHREADAAERLAMTVCSWCQAELDGVGRTYFDSLDDAMRAFGSQVGTHELIRNALRFVTYDQIWLPYSKWYMALGHQGRGVAWAGKTYVVPSFDTFVELPGHEETHDGGTPGAERVGEPCPKHFITMSVTGVRGLCE